MLNNAQGQNLKSITGLAFSPDGSKIYTASEGAAEVLEWDLKVRKKASKQSYPTPFPLILRPTPHSYPPTRPKTDAGGGPADHG